VKFKEVLQLADIDKVMDVLRDYYYSEDTEEKREAQIVGYEEVFNKLLVMTPVDKVSGNFDNNPNPHWRIYLDLVLPDGKFVDEPYIDVHAKNGTLQKEAEDYKYWKDNPNTTEEFANSEISYAIEFTPWDEWLGMDISEETLEQFPYEEIIAHCFWEMTFVDWSPDEIKKKSDELEAQVKEIEEVGIDELKKQGKIVEMDSDWINNIKEKLKKEIDDEE